MLTSQWRQISVLNQISTIQQVACLTDILTDNSTILTDNTSILTDDTSILTDNTTLLTCALSSDYSQRCAIFLTVILPLSCAPHCSGEVGAAGLATCTLSALTSRDANEECAGSASYKRLTTLFPTISASSSYRVCNSPKDSLGGNADRGQHKPRSSRSGRHECACLYKHVSQRT